MNKYLFEYLRKKRLILDCSEYKRLIIQGAIKINDKKLTEWIDVVVAIGNKINIGDNKQIIVE